MIRRAVVYGIRVGTLEVESLTVRHLRVLDHE
jgi:hypothetical protein